MFVKEIKKEDLKKRMRSLKIFEKDLLEKFILASKKGGQKVNKTSCCVYLKHLPTGLDVKCQKMRGRDANRYLARKILCDLFEEKILKVKTKKQKILEKKKKQKKQRVKRSLEKYKKKF